MQVEALSLSAEQASYAGVMMDPGKLQSLAKGGEHKSVTDLNKVRAQLVFRSS